MNSAAPQTSAIPGLATPYKTRHVRFIRPETVGDWRLKLYGIATHGRTPRPELVDAAMKLAPEVFPQPALSDDRYGVGVVLVHDAATMSIAIFYWWQSVNEMHQRVYVGPVDDPRALAKLPDPAAGCVYELSVLDFESRAWLQDVLANPNGPDVDRYLSRQLNADV
ncbi:MAG TPA: isochorismatase [Thermoanaerobaculia bacterium]|nr:isochorismatase [Thermoanaerobaculia bacterium]